MAYSVGHTELGYFVLEIIHTVGVRTGEMAQGFRAHTVLAVDLRSIPSIYIGCP